MYNCWEASPEERPSFEKLSSTLERRLEVEAGYIQLHMGTGQEIINLSFYIASYDLYK